LNTKPLRRSLLSTKTSRWLLTLGSAALLLIGIGLLALLTRATSNHTSYERYYQPLFIVNAVVAAGLGITILWGFVRLLVRLRRGEFGARLLLKLAAIFALVGVVPGGLIYVVSYQFVSRSIESWFDVKVEGALAAGLNLGRATLDTLSADLSKQSRIAAAQLAEVSEESASLALERVREQLGASDVVLWANGGRVLASAGQSRYVLRPPLPAANQLRDARAKGVAAVIEGVDDAAPGADKGRIVVLAQLPQVSWTLGNDYRMLQVIQPLSPTLVANALDVQNANREYQQRALARDGLRRMYIGTLTLSLFMAVLGAIVLAVLLGNQLARPLLLLALGMRQVAQGDLSPKHALPGKDELGDLTRSFAAMTQQLSDARKAVHQSLDQLEAARAQLQTILDNLTAGVLLMDALGHIQSANPGATRILRVPVAAHEGKLLSSLHGLEALAQGVEEQFAQLHADTDVHALDHWQKSFEVHASGSGIHASAVTLLARGAFLPDGTRLLVFDDISEVVSAQRAQAWGEVARRLAHEIKNPLTPIQLSAERLQFKLADKLEETDARLLDKSVQTIVDQVDAMKRLVNEFRDYARLPAAELKPLDLNALIQDVMGLYAQDTSQDRMQPAIELELDPQCPPIQGDAQQLRQVVHNLLQNAQDACEASGRSDAKVQVATSFNAERGRVRLRVRDAGKGFPASILQRAFEPYVTTKAKGTGLGLAVVKKIADEHGAKIELSNLQEQGETIGAQVSLSFKVNRDNA
jgi:nitrogen fixation/metabolism regulation signal transduction histidine kinase